jgi:hypothetical protein
MKQHDVKLRFLALLGARRAAKSAAGDPQVWQTFEEEWRSAKGAPWLFSLAMWAGVDESALIRAMCACIRIGISGESGAGELAETIDKLARVPGEATDNRALEQQMQEITRQLSHKAWKESGKRSHGKAWRVVYWSRAAEAVAVYLFQAKERGNVNWELIGEFAGAVEGYEQPAAAGSLNVMCAAAARRELPALPEREALPEPISDDSPGEESSYLEAGFDVEEKWLAAERCWLALRPASVLRIDPGDGPAIWDALVRGVPQNEEDAGNVLESVAQAEITIGAAKKVSDNLGRLYFESLSFPNGAVDPIKWFAEAFSLRVVSVNE